MIIYVVTPIIEFDAADPVDSHRYTAAF